MEYRDDLRQHVFLEYLLKNLKEVVLKKNS